MDDDSFPRYVAGRLAGLPGIAAVTLGGSRASGTHRPDSDWDFSIYYRGRFDPQALRDLGWPGEVFEVGGWSKGVFNGGAWLQIDGRKTDVHYRDLDVIDRVLHGQLPVPEYPTALRERAPKVWWGRAEQTFGYARANHALYGRVTPCAGLVAQATSQAAHAVLAARGEWITNEKQLLTRAGLRPADDLLAAAGPDPAALLNLVDSARSLCRDALLAICSDQR